MPLVQLTASIARRKRVHQAFLAIDSGGSDFPKDYAIPLGGVSVLVVGFLSSEGQFVHLGMYKYEILRRRLTLSKSPN